MTTDPQTPVEDLEGRGLDAAVAKAVFGKCTVIGCGGMPTYEFQSPPESGDDTRLCSHCGNEVWQALGESAPQFSTDIAAAWELVEEMQGDRARYLDLQRMTHPWHNLWRADFKTGKQVLGEDSGSVAHAEAKTAPLAICRAALRAVRE